MTATAFRSLGSVLLAIAGAAAVGATSVIGAKAIISEAKLLANEGWIMGGTGLPDPTTDPSYIPNVEALYLSQFDNYTFQGLTTPEQFCPFTSCPPGGLTFGDSLNQGVTDLNNAIGPQLEAGDNVAVLGYSQSATLATIEMQNLINNTPAGVDLDNLHVVLLGDPNNPIGGILDRFQFPDGLNGDPQHVPFVDIPLGIAPTPTTDIPTDIYTGEYDGWANFPLDPSNLLADLNALIGIETVHPYYPDPTPGVNLDTNNMIDLGTIGDTHFYDIPAPLPLLAFMYDGGPAGRFFYDLFSPSMSLGINWAYGNPGDPFVGVNGTDAIGPWQVNASGDLVESGVAGFFPKMDPLQMLAGMEYAGVQSFVNPINDLLADAGQPALPQSFVDSMLSGYDLTNQLDATLLTQWADLTASIPSLGPDAIFDGAPLISAQPLIDLVGYGFDTFNFFGA